MAAVGREKQVKAARCLLGWSQRDLARRARVGLSTVADFERGARDPIHNNVAAIMRALEEGGIKFVPNGVLMREAGV
jgi:predicted transcriptional regulator